MPIQKNSIVFTVQELTPLASLVRRELRSRTTSLYDAQELSSFATSFGPEQLYTDVYKESGT